MVTDETLFAWLDGELEPSEAERVAAAVAADRELAARAEQHRAMQARLGRAFDGLLTKPVPDAIAEAARATDPQVVDFAAAKRMREAPVRTATRAPLPQWAALAASLAIGLFAGAMIAGGSDDALEVQGGKVYAAAALGEALDTQLASAPAGDVRIGLTFRDQAGTICRTFTDAAASGLACRDDGRWQMRGLFAAPEGQGGPYRMAAGTDPNLAALVGSTMAGEPFDANREKAAKAQGWR